jgi:hypothetical protein
MLETMAKAARFAFLALTPALISALISACVEPAGAAHIVGPDGTQMLHVHCGDEQAACFRLAGEMCPRGYFLSPIFDPHDGNFLVRCKDASQFGVIANAAPPAPAPAAAAAPVVTQPASVQPAQPAQFTAVQPHGAEADWPPHEVAKPSEPWPAPSAGAPVPKTAIGDVDLGY